MDPTGEHCFISMTNNDVLYLNRESSNPVRLAKLKEKSKLECIAWDEMACHSQGVETNRILFAFANGALYQGSCTNALYGDGSIFVKDLVYVGGSFNDLSIQLQQGLSISGRHPHYVNEVV